MGGWWGQLNEYKSGDQPVTECWTAGFEDLTPFIIFACCIWSQFTEPKGSAGAERPLTLSLRGEWPEAEPTCLFTTYFMFVLYYYGLSWIGCLHWNRIPLVIQRVLSIQCDSCESLFTHRFDTVHVWLFEDRGLIKNEAGSWQRSSVKSEYSNTASRYLFVMSSFHV